METKVKKDCSEMEIVLCTCPSLNYIRSYSEIKLQSSFNENEKKKTVHVRFKNSLTPRNALHNFPIADAREREKCLKINKMQHEEVKERELHI